MGARGARETMSGPSAASLVGSAPAFKSRGSFPAKERCGQNNEGSETSESDPDFEPQLDFMNLCEREIALDVVVEMPQLLGSVGRYAAEDRGGSKDLQDCYTSL